MTQVLKPVHNVLDSKAGTALGLNPAGFIGGGPLGPGAIHMATSGSRIAENLNDPLDLARTGEEMATPAPALPAQQSTPAAPRIDSASVAAEDAEQALRRRRGRASTILAGSKQESNVTKAKQLLGD